MSKFSLVLLTIQKIDSKWNGMYDAKTNLITINTRSRRAIESIVWHEVTHFIQETNPQAYKTLVETIKKNTKRVNETTPATKKKAKKQQTITTLK